MSDGYTTVPFFTVLAYDQNVQDIQGITNSIHFECSNQPPTSYRYLFGFTAASPHPPSGRALGPGKGPGTTLLCVRD
jgi:hypothetical protein